MKELSIFADESGDFGEYSTHSPYYIVVMVLHDQTIKKLDAELSGLGYEKVILYYDNGQYQLNRILNTVLATELAEYDVRKVLPSNYRLFQAADLICTLELLWLKSKAGNLTRSEMLIFHSNRELKKDFLKGIYKKTFKCQE